MILKADKAVLFFARMIDQMLPAKVVFQNKSKELWVDSDGITILVRIFHSREKIHRILFGRGFRERFFWLRFFVFGLSEVLCIVVFFVSLVYDLLQYVIEEIHLFVFELFWLLYFSMLV